MLNARQAALRCISLYRRNGAWSDMVLDSLIKSGEIIPDDASLSNIIALGTVENMTYLDHIISSFCNMPLRKLHPITLDILRISAYQIIFLDRIPHSAAVNEAVAITKKQVNARAAGLVNAVLRKISQSIKSLPEIPRGDMTKYLSVRYSHSEFITRELIKNYGTDGAEAFLRRDNERPDITVHTNTLRYTPDEVRKFLDDNDISYTENSHVFGSFTLKNAGNIEKSSAFSDGMFYVQDNSAHIAALAAMPQPSQRILDVCAAPGGKSIAAAIAMQNLGEIVSCDIHENKLRKIEENAKRLGISIIKTVCRDASVYENSYDSAFDTVIADVPCSGFGVIRKKPEIRYKSDEDTKNLPDIQRAIIYNVSRYVRPGGTLIYSTCTVLPRENEDVVNAFLKDNHDFYTESFDVFGETAESGMMTLLPHIHNTDGFFIARLRRRQ